MYWKIFSVSVMALTAIAVMAGESDVADPFTSVEGVVAKTEADGAQPSPIILSSLKPYIRMHHEMVR